MGDEKMSIGSWIQEELGEESEGLKKGTEGEGESTMEREDQLEKQKQEKSGKRWWGEQKSYRGETIIKITRYKEENRRNRKRKRK